jgi:hypothetical protein
VSRQPIDEVAGDQVWRELRWFDFDRQFAGRYIQFAYDDRPGDTRLKLHRVLFDDVDAPVLRYTYVALPADRVTLARFLREIAAAEGISLA